MATRRSVPTRTPSTTEGTPGYESPFKPPAGFDDLTADAEQPQWHERELAGRSWRIKTPTAAALHPFTMAISNHNKNTEIQFKSMKIFIQTHMHPDDFGAMLLMMMDPDSGFDDMALRKMLRLIATTGTARPFVRWPTSLSRRRTAGAR